MPISPAHLPNVAAKVLRTLATIWVLGTSLQTIEAGLVQPDPDTTLTNRFDGPWVVGFDFTVDAETTIDALGVEDDFGDGLTIPSAAGLWDITEIPSVEIATVEIPAGTDAVLEDGFRYVATNAPITLMPGRTYRIGALVGAGIPFTDTFSGSGTGFAGAGVTMLVNRYAGGGTLTEPVLDGTLAPGRWAGANATLLGSTPGGDALQIIEVVYAETGGEQTVQLTWRSTPGAFYTIRRNDDLSIPFFQWFELTDGFGSGGTETIYVDTSLPPGTGRMFYKVMQNPPN